MTLFVKKFEKMIIKRYHWRDIGHSELAELYATMSMRTLAIGMVSVFLPLYLYELGYSFTEIMWYYFVFSACRLVLNFVGGAFVGRIGPKHTIAVSTVIQVCFLLMLLSLESYGWPLWSVSFVHTVANALFFTAYHVDFSKIKRTEHAGKEYGHLVMIQKIFGMIGPFVGGILATWVGVRLNVAVAIVLFMGSLVPLFMSKEPVRTHQHVNYRGILPKMARYWRNILAVIAINSGLFLPNITWTLFIGIAVFTSNTYAYIGVLTTLSTVFTIAIARYIGDQTDKNKGPFWIRLGAGLGAGISFSRFFITSPVAVTAEGFATSQALTMRQIPVAKGFYADSDEFPGQRIAYMVMLENAVHLSRLPLMGVLIWLLSSSSNQLDVLRYTSATLSMLVLLMFFERFSSLRAKR